MFVSNRISFGSLPRLAMISILAATGSATFPADAPAATPSAAANASAAVTGGAESGLAAVYSSRLNGHRTASGQIYDPKKLTAAHKTLPFGSKVKVTNAKNGKSVIVRINDRGPMQAGRVLDLSPRAARALGIHRLGMAEVTVEPAN